MHFGKKLRLLLFKKEKLCKVLIIQFPSEIFQIRNFTVCFFCFYGLFRIGNFTKNLSKTCSKPVPSILEKRTCTEPSTGEFKNLEDKDYFFIFLDQDREITTAQPISKKKKIQAMLSSWFRILWF